MQVRCVLLVILCLAASVAAQDWPQWGGPSRNFKSESKGLAGTWPASGPKRLWSRDLGEGYSGISVEGGVLYTMYRQGDDEVAVALDAASGKTLWEHRYAAPLLSSMKMENGPGPHTTPLAAGPRVFIAGVTGKFFALDKKTGKVHWAHDLWKDFHGQLMGRGYSCSPLAYKNTVIVNVGGAGEALVAFSQKDGSVVWKNQNFDLGPASPMLIQFGGQDQLVAFTAGEVSGLDPNNGELLWSIPHRTSWGLNISTPVWANGDTLFVSSAYNGGSRAIKLSRVAGKIVATELWANNRMRVHIGSVIHLAGHVYGSSGDFGPAFITAVDLKDGRVVWQERGFAKANFVYAEGKLIILDEDGTLALATVSPEGLKVLAKAEVLRSNVWTAPALAGTRLYVRDRRTIAAFDLM